jgi:hypothetical protein
MVIRVTRRPDARADLKTVHAGIGAELRTLLFDPLREFIPNGMAALLRQLDRSTEDKGSRQANQPKQRIGASAGAGEGGKHC